MSSTACIVQAPLSILASVEQMRVLQYPHLDFRFIHGFLEKGASHELEAAGVYVNVDGKADPRSLVVDSQGERRVMDRYDRLVGANVADITSFLSAVAPKLVRFSLVLSNAREYIDEQIKQCNTLIGLGNILYAIVAVYLAWEVYSMYNKNLNW